MPQYIIQKTQSDCAPTAIINAGKWSGKKISFKNDYNRIFKEINCNWYGTKYKDIDQTLRRELNSCAFIRKIKNPSFLKTTQHLENGEAALISYYYKRRKEIRCHIALFSGFINNNLIGHNILSKPNEKISMTKFIKMFYNPYGNVRVWHLSKK